jgi:predicted flavoprotein YhiN
MALIRHLVPKDEFVSREALATHLKNLRLRITGTGPIEDAISTVGGIALDEVDTDFQLKKRPGVYAIGEMLDYDAPTGGYLLQSCFSMAWYLANHLNDSYK